MYAYGDTWGKNWPKQNPGTHIVTCKELSNLPLRNEQVLLILDGFRSLDDQHALSVELVLLGAAVNGLV